MAQPTSPHRWHHDVGGIQGNTTGRRRPSLHPRLHVGKFHLVQRPCHRVEFARSQNQYACPYLAQSPLRCCDYLLRSKAAFRFSANDFRIKRPPHKTAANSATTQPLANQRRFKRVALYRHRPCRVPRPFDSDRRAREPSKPSERRSRMRRGSLPRGSAHRLYRSRLPNGFDKLGHHHFRSGSMGNGGERRTPKPKNACGSRVCTPMRCVRSSSGRVNRSKHARPFQCRRERNSGRLARLRVFHGRAVLRTRFDGSCNQRTCDRSR